MAGVEQRVEQLSNIQEWALSKFRKQDGNCADMDKKL